MSDKKLLIIEDDPIISELIMWRLKDMGYTNCRFVKSGEDGITVAAEFIPDLIIVDITLEGEIDGIEAIEEIKAANAEIPFIYLSSHMEEDIIERALATKPSGYIAKPFEDFELRMGIEIALNR